MLAVLDGASQGLDGPLETDLMQVHRAKTAGQVAGLANGLIQQAGDLGGGVGRGGIRRRR